MVMDDLMKAREHSLMCLVERDDFRDKYIQSQAVLYNVETLLAQETSCGEASKRAYEDRISYLEVELAKRLTTVQGEGEVEKLERNFRVLMEKNRIRNLGQIKKRRRKN